MDKRIRTLRELAVVMSTLPAGSLIEPRYMQACEPNFIIRLIDGLEEEIKNAQNMVRDLNDLREINRLLGLDNATLAARNTMLEAEADGYEN